MRRLLLAIASLVLAGPALAADLPAKAPPSFVPAAAPYSGFYIGVNGGGAQTTGAFSFLELPGTGNLKPSAGKAGLTAGYGPWLGSGYLGVEADADYDFTKQNVPCVIDLTNCKIKSGWFFTQRLVLGTSIGAISGTAAQLVRTPQGWTVPSSAWAAALVPYVTGGVAERRIEACIDPMPCGKEWLVGWTVGGGLKFPVSTHVTFDVSYLYTSWNKSFSPAPSLPPAFTIFKAIDEQALIARLLLTL